MQNLGDFEMWRQRREEFAREMENERRARRLRAARPRRSSRSVFVGRLMSWARGINSSPFTKGA